MKQAGNGKLWNWNKYAKFVIGSLVLSRLIISYGIVGWDNCANDQKLIKMRLNGAEIKNSQEIIPATETNTEGCFQVSAECGAFNIKNGFMLPSWLTNIKDNINFS